MRFGDLVAHPFRELQVNNRSTDVSINVLFAARGERVRIKGVSLPLASLEASIPRALAALNDSLPDYIAPVTEAEVLSHV